MAQIIWTEPALSSLEELAEYVALHNVAAAQQLVQSVFKAVERLEAFPLSGRKPPELETLSYREVVVNPCRIFYRVADDDVFIVSVMRQERLLAAYMFNGGV